VCVPRRPLRHGHPRARVERATDGVAGPADVVGAGGSRLWLEADVEDRDRYGRLLRYLWHDDGTLINEALVRQGWARTGSTATATSPRPLVPRSTAAAWAGRRRRHPSSGGFRAAG
jgi:hypothetical protein